MPLKNPLKIVALSGKMGSGKTYVSDHLKQKYGFHQIRFAGPLKDDIRSMGFPEWAIQDKPDWMRLLMQVYGQAWRAIDPDHWAKQAIVDISNIRAMQLSASRGAYDGLPGIVIDDVRFPNEVQALLDLDPDEFDVTLIRLHRIGDPGQVSHTSDASETALDHSDEFDVEISIQAGDVKGLVRSVQETLGLSSGG